MGPITSLGIGSGADLSGLVNQLVAVERQPLNQMRSAAAGLQTQVSSYGRLSSQLSALQTAANKLNNVSLWTQSKATSGDESVVSVTGGSGAAAGNYSVTVNKLASNQTVVSGTSLPSASTQVGSGRLSIEIGQWQQQPMNFVPQVGRASVEVEATADDTLATLRDKINAQGAGVTASLVTDSTGVRLSLRSTDSGAENGFRIQASDDDGQPTDNAGLSRFAFDPQSGTTAMESRREGSNAIAYVNGIRVESASNEITGAVEGLSFRLRKEGSSAEVSVSSDREAVTAAIKGFADSYNELARNIADQTRFDPTSRQGGPLQGDSAVGSLQRQLRSLINGSSGASSTFSRLSEIGLEVQRDGSLALNDTKLAAATNNMSELRKAFANSDSNDPSNNGFARRYADMASKVLGVDGTLTTRTESLQKMLAKNSDDQVRLSDRVDRFQQRLVAQYTALDANLARLNALSSSLTQQLDRLSGFNNKN